MHVPLALRGTGLRTALFLWIHRLGQGPLRHGIHKAWVHRRLLLPVGKASSIVRSSALAEVFTTNDPTKLQVVKLEQPLLLLRTGSLAEAGASSVGPRTSAADAA